jgi:hypothetical protein
MATEMIVRLHIEPVEQGLFVGTSPDVPGLVVQAGSAEEVASLVPDIVRAMVESYEDSGDVMPQIPKTSAERNCLPL